MTYAHALGDCTYLAGDPTIPLNLRVASWCLYHKLDWTRPSADPQASGQTSKRISGGCEIRPVFLSSSGLGATLLLQCACTTSSMSVMSPSRPVSQHGLPKYREVSKLSALQLRSVRVTREAIKFCLLRPSATYDNTLGEFRR